MYSAACRTSAEGLIAFDTHSFARAVADAGVGVLAEQELYQLALLAVAEGNTSLPEEDIVAALSKAS